MKCELCHRHDAQTVVFRKEADGASRELYVCRACADAERAFGGPRGINVTAMEAPEPPTGNLPQQLLGKLESLLSRLPGAPEGNGEGAALRGDGPPRCPACGLSLDDLQTYSLAGCPHCYKAFGEALRSVVADMQGCRTYAGDRPPDPAPDAPAARETRLEALRQALQEAVEREDYVKAKALREAIRRLEEDPDGPSPEEEGPHGV